jgi:hypothetical protein
VFVESVTLSLRGSLGTGGLPAISDALTESLLLFAGER